MKNTNINISRTAAVSAAIDAAQKGARVRKIDADMILQACGRIQRKIGISKKAMHGVEISVDLNAQAFPCAYHGIPESTQFRAVYRSGAWYLVDVWRGVCRRPSGEVYVEYTDAARAAIMDKMESISV